MPAGTHASPGPPCCSRMHAHNTRLHLPINCLLLSATYGGPVLDGMVFYWPEGVTDAFKSATQGYVERRFVPRLQVRRGAGGGRGAAAGRPAAPPPPLHACLCLTATPCYLRCRRRGCPMLSTSLLRPQMRVWRG